MLQILHTVIYKIFSRAIYNVLFSNIIYMYKYTYIYDSEYVEAIKEFNINNRQYRFSINDTKNTLFLSLYLSFFLLLYNNSCVILCVYVFH